MIQRFKALAARLMATRPARAGQRYNELRGNRLAGAVSFYGFVSLFPLLILAAVVASQVMGQQGVQELQDVVDENLPGLNLDVASFADQAGTIGVVGAVTLLWTGLGWVDATRAAVRSMWKLDDAPGNVVTRKLADLAALIGLGVVLTISLGATVAVSAAADQVLEWLGLPSDNSVLAGGIALIIAIGASSVLFGYMLAGLPRIRIPLRVLLPVALVGGLVFELLKQLVTQFAVLVVPNNAYAAFAVPLALIAWIYLVTRLLMGLAAATAEWAADHPEERASTAPLDLF
jgi:membrane protein